MDTGLEFWTFGLWNFSRSQIGLSAVCPDKNDAGSLVSGQLFAAKDREAVSEKDEGSRGRG